MLVICELHSIINVMIIVIAVFLDHKIKKTTSNLFFFVRARPKPGDCCFLHGADQIHQIRKAGEYKDS